MSPASRSLRIGLVLHGQLVEERIFHAGVTFGQSLKCSLSVPIDGVPREHALFTRDDGTYQLHTLAGMTARLGIGDHVDAIDGARTIAIARSTRGKLVLGDVTLLFQDIATPPARPRAQLPASIRGTFADRIDRRLAVIVGASLVAHIAIAAWAWTQDVDTGVLGQQNLSEYHQDVIDVTLPDRVERVDPTVTGTKPAVAPPVAPQHQIVPPRTPGHAAATDPQEIAREATRMASILTGDDGTTGFGGMNQRTPGADLNHQIDDARNHQISVGSTSRSRIDDRAHLGTSDNMWAPTDPTLRTMDVAHNTERGNQRFPLQPLEGPKDEPPSTLTAQMVLDKINGVYMTGLQRCYRLGQNDDGSLEGKVVLEIPVDENGKLDGPSASGLSAKVDSCVQTFMATWRFPIPRDKSGSPSAKTFRVSVQMKKG